MAFLIVLGVFIIMFCVFCAVAKPRSALPFLSIAGIITIAIALLPSPKKEPESEYMYNDPSAYEEHQSMISESCSHAQEGTSDNLYCSPGQ